ncbi:unnamed protein product [Symbiodinium microadriaticum]|nr:unnamed protein product [Symbiodinium microadriaticum]CAE7746846.1 unnamed protein product [Symbiodinium sp. KB8]
MAGLVVLSWTGYREQIAERQTHFMSWTWRYALAEMRSALEMYRVSVAPAIATDSVFFFMCFFVNNQFRIIVEESTTGSQNLEQVFETNLRRIGKMVAVLFTLAGCGPSSSNSLHPSCKSRWLCDARILDSLCARADFPG